MASRIHECYDECGRRVQVVGINPTVRHDLLRQMGWRPVDATAQSPWRCKSCVAKLAAPRPGEAPMTTTPPTGERE